MIETDARALVRDCGGFGGLEAWIAGRRWKTTPGGWTVTGEFQQGWHFGIDANHDLPAAADLPRAGRPRQHHARRHRRSLRHAGG
jgi:hypothetical protein